MGCPDLQVRYDVFPRYANVNDMLKLHSTALLATLCLFNCAAFAESATDSTTLPLQTGRSVADVLVDIGPETRSRWKPFFDKAWLPYPSERLTFIVIKNPAVLEIWAETARGPIHIRSYGILKLSGTAGPKLREGDGQVPEGVYAIEHLNPNSKFHLSIKLDYPNDFDLSHALEEGRIRPGSNIFIHGSYRSIGCIAMGSQTIEELFVLAADTGIENIKVIIAPVDFRQQQYDSSNSRLWVTELYKKLSRELSPYQLDG